MYTIYNTSSTSVSEGDTNDTSIPIANRYWSIEKFHPEGFFTNASTQNTLHGLFAHTKHKFEWVSEGVKFTRGFKEDGSIKYVPYNYQNLLQFYSPYLLYCYWDYKVGKVIQIDIQYLLTGGGFRYRHLTIPEFNTYLFCQHGRAKVILSRRDDWYESPVLSGETPDRTLIQKVFNTKWTNGFDVFPITCSQKEISQWMPHFHWHDEGITFPTMTMEPGRTGGYRLDLSLQTLAFTTKEDMPAILETFQQLIGETLSPDELHEVLDQCDYRKDVRKGRITTAIRLLKQEGIELSRFSKKISGKVTWIYRVSTSQLELINSQSLVD